MNVELSIRSEKFTLFPFIGSAIEYLIIVTRGLISIDSFNESLKATVQKPVHPSITLAYLVAVVKIIWGGVRGWGWGWRREIMVE